MGMNEERILQKIKSRENWNAFVLYMFENIKLYAKKHNNLTEEIESEIEDTAQKIAKEIWDDVDGKIGKWAFGMVIGCSYNHDNQENPSILRIIYPTLGELLARIENDPDFTEMMIHCATSKNADFDITIRKV